MTTFSPAWSVILVDCGTTEVEEPDLFEEHATKDSAKQILANVTVDLLKFILIFLKLIIFFPNCFSPLFYFNG